MRGKERWFEKKTIYFIKLFVSISELFHFRFINKNMDHLSRLLYQQYELQLGLNVKRKNPKSQSKFCCCITKHTQHNFFVYVAVLTLSLAEEFFKSIL